MLLFCFGAPFATIASMLSQLSAHMLASCNRISFSVGEKWDFLVVDKNKHDENTMDACIVHTIERCKLNENREKKTHRKHIKISIKLLETIPFFSIFVLFFFILLLLLAIAIVKDLDSNSSRFLFWYHTNTMTTTDGIPNQTNQTTKNEEKKNEREIEICIYLA